MSQAATLVEAVVLRRDMGERRLFLGLNRHWSDPWLSGARNFRRGSAIAGRLQLH